MSLSTEQRWQAAYRRLLLVDTEKPVTETQVDDFLQNLPKRLECEDYGQWLKRGRRLAKVIAFPKIRFQSVTDVQRLAADTRILEDALPKKPLLSRNKLFRLTVDEIGTDKIKLLVEALGRASNKYAHRLIGIAGEHGKDDLICIMRLDADGEASEELENTASVRRALLHPVIGLIEQA